MGVWIETGIYFRFNAKMRSHTLRGCVDWNQSSWTPPKPKRCHTLRGCVEWNRKQILFSEPTWKSHFYENVPLIVNKLQRQKIWFGTFSSGLILWIFYLRYVDMLCLINELFYFVDHYGLVLFNNFWYFCPEIYCFMN